MKGALAVVALGVAAAAAGPAQARQWSSPAAVPGSFGTGYPYDVAVAADGTAAVAFVRDGVRVANRLPDGRWGRAVKVSTGSHAVANASFPAGSSSMRNTKRGLARIAADRRGETAAGMKSTRSSFTASAAWAAVMRWP